MKYISDINVKIVEQTENAVIIQLSNTEEILKEL